MDPVFGPLLLAILVAYYVLYRFGGVLWALASWTGAKTLDGVAHVTGRATSNPVLKWLNRKSTAGSDWLRKHRRSPMTPLTRSGQRLLERLTARLRATGRTGWYVGLLIRWGRLTWVDAVAAARSGRQRRRTQPNNGARWWRDWLSWPTGDDPEAPIYAHAIRLDRESTTPALPAPTPEAEPQVPADTNGEVIDSDIVDEPPTTTPIAPTPWPALTTGRTNTMSSYTAEGGLDAYILHSEHMAAECDNALHSAEGTLASLTTSGWSGPGPENYNHAMELLQAASNAFSQANEAFRKALSVRDQYNVNEGAGNKESIMN